MYISKEFSDSLLFSVISIYGSMFRGTSEGGIQGGDAPPPRHAGRRTCAAPKDLLGFSGDLSGAVNASLAAAKHPEAN